MLCVRDVGDIMKSAYAIVTVASVFVAVVAVVGCALPDMPAFYVAEETESGDEVPLNSPSSTDELEEIIVSGTSAILRWDAPAGTVTGYKVYYRDHGTGDAWTFLADVAASADPSYTVEVTDLGVGSYDFAITSVDGSETESDLHTSLDETADPPTGWFLTWQ